MPAYLENLGLDFIAEEEASLMGILSYAASKGEVVKGYSGNAYINHHFGSAQFVLRTSFNEAEERFEINGFDVHSRGICDWKVRIFDDLSVDNIEDTLQKKCIVSNSRNGSGMAIMNFINADVLPCYSAGEDIVIQPIGFPIELHYYKNSEEFEDSMPSNEKTGEKWLPGEGSILPIKFLFNHQVRANDNDEKPNRDDDEVMLIRGRVKGVFVSYVEIEGESFPAYINTVIETQFGDLEIVHTREQVEENERDNICIGSEVVGSFVLCGDVALNEYCNGAIFDEEHDLLLIRDVVENGNAKRLFGALDENAVYLSKTTQKTFNGRNEIIERFQYLFDNCKDGFSAALAETDVDSEKKLCLLIVKNKSEDGSLLFIETDNNGKIIEIITDEPDGYLFNVSDTENLDEDIPQEIDSYEKNIEIGDCLMYAAANVGRVGFDVRYPDHFEKYENKNIFIENAERIVSQTIEFCKTLADDQLENIFNYAFLATALFSRYGEEHLLEDAIETVLQGTPNIPDSFSYENVLMRSNGIGKTFFETFDAFKNYLEREDKDFVLSELLKESLVAIFRMGELYGKAKW